MGCKDNMLCHDLSMIRFNTMSFYFDRSGFFIDS